MVGDWISVGVNVERRPARFALTVTVGELPVGWTRHGRPARTWSAVIGLALIAPFVVLLAAGVLRSAGFGYAYAWIANSPYAIMAATVSLFIGIPVAATMNVWRITHLGLRRGAGLLEGLFALELAPLHLIVVALAVGLGGLFVGHLAVDAFACANGVRSAC